MEEGEPSHIASQSNLWSRDEPNATQLFSELVQIRNRASASVGVLVKCRIVVCVYDQLLPCPLSFLADVIDSNRNGGALEYIKQEWSCCLTVEKMAPMISKQGKCTPDCFSLWTEQARLLLTDCSLPGEVSHTNCELLGSIQLPSGCIKQQGWNLGEVGELTHWHKAFPK